MNDLVQHLSGGRHAIGSSGSEKSAKAFKDCIDRKYVHILFKETGTELGTRLDWKNCNLATADFTTQTGKVHLEGSLILNFTKVKVVVDIDLETLDGEGFLIPVNDEEYSRMAD